MMAYCQRNAAGNAFITLSSLTFFTATVLVPLRAYIRLRIVKNFWWDDACLITAYVSAMFSACHCTTYELTHFLRTVNPHTNLCPSIAVGRSRSWSPLGMLPTGDRHHCRGASVCCRGFGNLFHHLCPYIRGAFRHSSLRRHSTFAKTSLRLYSLYDRLAGRHWLSRLRTMYSSKGSLEP